MPRKKRPKPPVGAAKFAEATVTCFAGPSAWPGRLWRCLPNEGHNYPGARGCQAARKGPTGKS
eukprot:scaffold344785_cov39-Prasinocladus_malaysianus.AAC.1